MYFSFLVFDKALDSILMQVLVNNNTASASEIVSSSIYQHTKISLASLCDITSSDVSSCRLLLLCMTIAELSLWVKRHLARS